MGHSITALVVKNVINNEAITKFDLVKVDIGFNLSLFYFDHYYTACWQYKTKTDGYLDFKSPKGLIIPNEEVVTKIACSLTEDPNAIYAILATDYFGGIGEQWAQVFAGNRTCEAGENSIDAALKYLGVESQPGKDEFDSVGLGIRRSNPEYLEKYVDLADELGV